MVLLVPIGPKMRQGIPFAPSKFVFDAHGDGTWVGTMVVVVIPFVRYEIWTMID